MLYDICAWNRCWFALIKNMRWSSIRSVPKTDGGMWSEYFGGWVLAYTRMNESATTRSAMPRIIFMAVFIAFVHDQAHSS